MCTDDEEVSDLKMRKIWVAKCKVKEGTNDKNEQQQQQ
jgi:hypothetical protein